MKINRPQRWLLPLLLLALAAPAAYAGNGVLDQIQTAFQSASTGWMTASLNLARPLFFGLAGLEFAWAAINYTLRKNDLGELLTSITLKILGIAFFAMLLTEAPTWIPPIINSFVQAGQTVGGGGATSISSAVGPSEILDAGINTAAKVISVANGINGQQTSSGISIFHPGDSIAALGQGFLSAIFIGMTGLMIILGFLAIAIQLLITTIESYIVIGGGALMLGFAGSRWTLPFAEKYFGYAVSVGIKLFTIYLVAGFGGQLANIIIQHWAAVQAGAPPNNVVGPVDFLTAGATALAYGAVGYLVPGIAGSMMNGSPAMSLSNAGAAAGGMAVAPIAAGLAGGAAGMRGASALAGLLPDSRSGGAKGGIGGSAMLGGGPVGGVSGTSRLESLASGAGKGLQTAGQGVSAAGSAAGTGIKAASGAANVIPVAGQAIAAVGAAVGTGVEAAGKVAGKGLEATGKAVEGAGKVAGKAAEGAGKAVEGVKSGAELGKADAPATQEAGLSSARTTVGSTPGGNGFASTQSQIGASADASPAANAADASAAQRQFEKDNAPKPKGRSLADTLKSGAQSLQYEANRRKPGLSHDGQSGGVSIRMNHID
ncbi:putative Type IV secretory pathway TrbL components-like protein [Thiomonas arsenitoxydans]|jgi:type IV secretion system protein TrbL|uniref:Type IV secretory pathway TrbL components-like protein n=1 Tax=Thiomonas arsenitoxydans (strain DSM 22701 / CIP 110005 / 3As) TaxID=426114 RepID=A0ABP1Z1X7_THIA3|nr:MULTISPECIES: P-type conjugative transfer protein TrbL [Thiomonas]MDE1978275.1 P-type conjugative transfer protein TrbL [Betaproteobacteria bacterium]CQR44200.1 putative Type IV secretory pathway TrbL components-like protein [Thiomonas sp. CB3]OZB70554.1 MAG: P-type conjugative transfer protein TrbL [Thiomonas sp. 13-64-67]CDW95860.1 putative Type IV secretory pathway TrbL components-like protein [Thiomonas sp. CB2]CQR26447.1 putative Type IV secretory pathway TrbL components-like protein [